MNIIERLNWRYATKTFDPSKKLTVEQLNILIEGLRLSPSSYGLQAWKFLIIENPEVRQKIRTEGANNQPQITDASHLLVLCSLKELTDEHLEKYLNSLSRVRNLSEEQKNKFKESLISFKERKLINGVDNWLAKQVYIALGVLMTVCAVENIDACPMEGFDPNKVDEILGLAEKNLCSRLICPVGFRQEGVDEPRFFPKVRFNKEEVVEEIK